MSFLGKDYLIRSRSGKEIFEAVKDLPIIDPHNHANVKEIAANLNYPDLWQLFAATDHYVWEALRKRGVAEEYLTGDRPPRDKWLKLADVFPELIGNPVYEWLHLDLRRYLGVERLIGPDTGQIIWDEANATLATPECRPLALLKTIGVEAMCSTDDPIDLLEEHAVVNRQAGHALVRPTWRPDKAMNIAAPGWREYMAKVADRFNIKLASFADLIQAMRFSHDYFADNHCVASDHGVEIAPDITVDPAEADAAFKKGLNGKPLRSDEIAAFKGCFFREIAAFDAEKDWVFQLHLGAVRDVRDSLWETLGPDSGGDICNHFQNHLPSLKNFLNRFDGRLKVVLYCLDPGHQPLLATLSRAFGEKVKLGSAWWLCDHPVGMRRQLEYIGAVDVLANFAGMVSDSRKLLSYGSRFEMFRRVLADVLGEMADSGQAPLPLLRELAITMAYRGPKQFFNL